MQASRDSVVVDTLGDFAASLQSAVCQVQRDESRVAAVLASCRQAQALMESLESRRREKAERVEALEAECARIACLNEQRHAALGSSAEELGRLRAPRLRLEAATNEITKLSNKAKEQFCQKAMATTEAVLGFLSSRDPGSLKAELEGRRTELAAAERRVSKYQDELERISKLPSNQRSLNTLSDDLTDQYQELMNENNRLREKASASISSMSSRRDWLRSQLRNYSQDMARLDLQLQETQQVYYDSLDQSSSFTCNRCGRRLADAGALDV